jgi:hypothetical protein
MASIQKREAIDDRGAPTPWISYAAIHFLSQRVRPEFEVFEYGSGNSTLWWAKHVVRVVSCEHNARWYNAMAPRMPANVQYVHEPLENGNYAATIASYQPFDIVMIDGRDRVSCARFSVDRLKERGVIVFDNSDRDRYQPAFDLFASRGLRRLDFVSMGPISSVPISTSVFYSSRNCLEI